MKRCQKEWKGTLQASSTSSLPPESIIYSLLQYLIYTAPAARLAHKRVSKEHIDSQTLHPWTMTSLTFCTFARSYECSHFSRIMFCIVCWCWSPFLVLPPFCPFSPILSLSPSRSVSVNCISFSWTKLGVDRGVTHGGFLIRTDYIAALLP